MSTQFEFTVPPDGTIFVRGMICLFLSILSLGSAFVSAQEQELDFMKMMRTKSNRQYHKNANREEYRALWNGNGAVTSTTPLWQDESFRQELGLTSDQYAGLDFMYSKNGTMGHWYRTKAKTDPVLAGMLEEHDKLNQVARQDPYDEKMSEQDRAEYLEQLRNMSAYYYVETQKDVETILTPEQMQKVRESELALMSEIPILNPSMFESLDLTDEQRAQMEVLKKELEPEFEKIVEELVDLQDEIQELKYEMFEKVGIKFGMNGNLVDEEGKPIQGDPEKAKKKMESMEAEFAKNDKLQARIKRNKERASDFMNGFKLKMLDVLTDEQLEKMQKIIDNPTNYVKKIRDRIQRTRAAKEKNNWQPGIDSWRPGDPIPEEYLKKRKEKKKAFPTTEHSTP